MGCVIGAQSASVAACNATCLAATGCSFTFKGQTFNMCGDCSARWVDPQTLEPAILPGGEPYWPPGYGISGCDSANTWECGLGCRMAFDPSLNPGPPVDPSPPPALPLPPAPWPNAAPGFNFSEAFSDHVVLQRGPGAASVFGNTGALDDGASVLVTVAPSTGVPYSVPASVQGGRWRALLKPAAGFEETGLTYTITASCAAGCGGGAPVALSDVVFGDVFFCAGQSNAWLQLQFTYAHNSSRAAALAGSYDNIRLMSGDSQTQGLSPSTPPVHPWRTLRDAAALEPSDPDSWSQFSAVCYHTAESLTDQFKAAGKTPPTIGLVAMAIGGSTIEEWIPNEVAEKCAYFQHNANGGELNHVLWDTMVRTFVNMTVKGYLYYQGENNAGSLHGNLLTQTGYACLMPALIASWRAAWSATPGTTDPLAPFALCSLSNADSEGAGDIASFRFAQTGSYG